ncbi:unnamed protein product [Symbiodinium sp. CCMP2592]|nr:unnamed protein product [Symbiodinium sp. CCMP2592]
MSLEHDDEYAQLMAEKDRLLAACFEGGSSGSQTDSAVSGFLALCANRVESPGPVDANNSVELQAKQPVARVATPRLRTGKGCGHAAPPAAPPAAARHTEPQSGHPAEPAASLAEPESGRPEEPAAAPATEPESKPPTAPATEPQSKPLAAPATEPQEPQSKPPAPPAPAMEPPLQRHPAPRPTARRTDPQSGHPAPRPTARRTEPESSHPGRPSSAAAAAAAVKQEPDEDDIDRAALGKCRDPPKQLTKAAVDRRLYRIVQPRANGEYKVPKDVIDTYKDKDRRPTLMSMFEKLGYDPKLFVKKIKHLYERVHEKWVQTDYEFMTDADMEAAGWHTKRTVFQEALEGEADADADDMIEEMDEDCDPGEHEDDGEGQMEAESVSSESENEDRGKILRSIKCPDIETDQKPSEICSRMVKSAQAVVKKVMLEKLIELVSSISGYDDEMQQKQLRKMFIDVKSRLIEAMCTVDRAKLLILNGANVTSGDVAAQDLSVFAEMLGEGKALWLLSGVSATSVKRGYTAALGKPPPPPKEDGGQPAPKNAERDAHRLFSRLGLSLKLPIRTKTFAVDDGEAVEMHYIRIADWVKYLLKTPSLLAGAGTEKLESQCRAFWTMYKWHHPDHVVFHNEDKLSPMGCYEYDAEQVTCDCASVVAPLRQEVPDCYGPVAQQPESVLAAKFASTVKRHSYLTRHVLFGIPDFVYKDHPEIYPLMMDLVAAEAQSLFESGLLISNKRYHVAFIGCKGDMKHHAQVVFNLRRSYARVTAAGDQGICSMCQAGESGFPWEDISSDPLWSRTMYASRPWDIAPPLSAVPFDESAPERFIRLDLFHVVKVGIARDLAGGIALLCRLSFFDAPGDYTNINDRLHRAHASFKLWLSANNESAALRYFSPALFNLQKRLTDFAWTNTKASDTVLLVRYLHWFVSVELTNPSESGKQHRKLLRLLQSATKHLGTVALTEY